MRQDEVNQKVNDVIGKYSYNLNKKEIEKKVNQIISSINPFSYSEFENDIDYILFSAQKYMDKSWETTRGNIFEEIPDEPYELIGQPLNFKINIKEAKDLPENFCRDVQVEYTSFYDNIVHRTKVVKDKNKNPVFDEFFEHRIEYLTKDDIDLLLKEKVLIQ